MIITLFGKSIRIGKNPNQIDMFAGAEKEFAPGDRRKLEMTNGGKLRWKNADEEVSGKVKVESGKPKVISKLREEFPEKLIGWQDEDKFYERVKNLDRSDVIELEKYYDLTPSDSIHSYRANNNPRWIANNLMEELGMGIDLEKKKINVNPKFAGQKFVVPTFGVANNPNFKMPKEIDNDKIAELYRNSPISFQVDKMSNKAQEIYNNAGNQAEKQVAHDLWNLGNSIQEGFIDKYIKGKKISTEDVMEVKRIANEMIKGAEEEFEKIKSSGKAKITIKKKNSDRSSGKSEENKKVIESLKKQIAINNFPSATDLSKTEQAKFEAKNSQYQRIIDKLQNDEPLNKYEQKVIEENKLIDDLLEKQKSDRPRVETVKNPVQSEPDLVKKEPWERTLSDMVQNEITNREIFGPESYPKWITDNTKVEIADRRTGIVYNHFTLASPTSERLKHYGKLAHYEIVKQALDEGKPVPAEVLRDYPGLQSKKENGRVEITDVTPKGYGPDETETSPTIFDKLKGETTDQAIERNVGYQVENGKVKLEQDANGWKAIVFQGEEPQVIRAYKKQDVLNRVFKNLNPDAKFEDNPTNKSIFKNLFKAFGKQISMFGAQPYQKEGQTKEGRGGTLKLTRDSSGKGAHWRLASKQNPNDKKQIPKEEENKTGGKVITPANAYELLQDKIGNSVLLQDNEGNLLGEGALQLVNENSEGNYSIFVKEANGFDSVVPIPKNQAVVQKEDEINFKFADKKIVISTKEKSKLPNKPVEMEKAEENAKHARNLEKMRNHNEWQKQAESYARTANGQKDWFFGDLEIAADAEGLEFGVKNRIIKKADVLFKEIKRNATRDDKAEIFSALVGAFEVKSLAKAKAVISNLKKKGYEIDADQLDQPKDKENFFTRVKISKGENDPLPKELQFATGDYAKAFEETAKKPNPLRETEMSLGLKIAAESVPEFNTIKKQLFNKAGEGLGQLWVTGGLPGSGKSSTLGGEFYKNKVLIDPDSIKYILAEERGITKEEVDKKPWELHEESSNIAKHLVREAIREKKDVIYDVTMKGTENLNDLLYMVNSDTFQANAEFIHLPIEKGIERDKMRGEKGGRSIGADLYKKLFGDYPTHKAFFQLKDSFDNFRVYDNSAPLGEGAKLFYIKNDGQEKIIHPEIHEEFKKYGLKQMGKSLYLKYQRKKLLKALETEPQPAESSISAEGGGENTQELPTSEKIKLLLGFKEQGIDREIDPEQDFFALGMLKMHALIDENMNLTPEGEQKYQSQFGNKFSNMNGQENDIEKVVKPTLNIAKKKTDEG